MVPPILHSGDGGGPDAERRRVRQRDRHHARPQLRDRRAIVVPVIGQNNQVLQDEPLICEQISTRFCVIQINVAPCNIVVGLGTIIMRVYKIRIITNGGEGSTLTQRANLGGTFLVTNPRVASQEQLDGVCSF